MKKKVLSIFTTIAMICSFIYVMPDIEVDAAKRTPNEIVSVANEVYNTTWTPLKTIYGYGKNSTFEAGKTYHLPYGMPVNTGTFIGYNISISDFIAQTKNSNSKLYTSNSGYKSESFKNAWYCPYYAMDCSTFVSYCWGLSSRQTTSSLKSFGKDLGACNSSNISKIQIGDALIKSGHVALVTGVSNGTFEVTEETPPQLKRESYSSSQLISSFGAYNILRYADKDPVPLPEIDSAWNSYLPIKAFSVKTGVTYVYKSDFKTKDGGEIWGNVNGVDDECTIKKVFKNGWVEVEYPKSSGGTQIAYTPLSTFAIGSNVSSKLNFDIGITTYKRADRSETAGYFDPKTDKCIYIGTSGNSTQVLYTSTNGCYRLAFIDTECKLGKVNKAWNAYLPIKAYSVKTGRTPLYDIDLKTKEGGEIWGNVENNNEIIDDECIIHKVYESGWVKVEYPKTAGGTKTAYTPLSTFALGSDVSVKLNFDIGITTYKRADRSEGMGYFDPKTDKCVYIGTSGNSTQVLYTSTNGYYKLAFIDTECKLGSVNKAWNTYLPIKSYSIKTGKIPLYNIDLKTKSGGEIWGNVENNKEIVDDECIIHKVYENGWVKVEYPKTTGGTKTEYIKLSTFALGSDVNDKLNFDHKITTYKRADRSESAGMFDPKTDKCILIGYSGNSAQILYTSLNGYFRLAFIDKNEIIPQTTPTTTTKITTTTKVTTTTTTTTATKTTKATTTTAKTTKATTTTATTTKATTTTTKTTKATTTTTTTTNTKATTTTTTNIKKGDINNDSKINTSDIVIIQNYLIKKIKLDGNQLKSADMNSDNNINVFDVIKLKRILLKG